MSMDEEALRAVLTRIAADPGPPARIDIDAARRHGRLLARRGRFSVSSPRAGQAGPLRWRRILRNY